MKGKGAVMALLLLCACAPRRDSEIPQDIRGQVFNAAGRPLHGARVHLISTVRWEDGHGSSISDAVFTEAAGCFRVPVKASKWEDSRYEHTLLVLAQGHRRFERPLHGRSMEVRLETGRRLSGRVTEPDGTPLSGARVCCERTGETWCNFDHLLVTTDADGRYTIDFAEPGEHWVLARPPDSEFEQFRSLGQWADRVFPDADGVDFIFERSRR